MNRRRTGQLLRVVVTLGLLVYVCQRAGLFDAQGRSRLAEMILAVDPVYLALSIGVGLAANVACALKWGMLLASRSIRVSLARLYALYMVGRFFNLVLPTSVGGDVVRMYELGRRTARPDEAVASVFVERFTGMVTLMALALVTVLANPETFDLSLIHLALGAGCAAVTLLGWLAFDARPLGALERHTVARLPLASRMVAKARRIHDAVTAYRDRPAALWIAVANSLLFYLLAVVNVWVSARAFSVEVAVETMVAAVPVILLIMNLPVSIGGIGLMEFAYTFTFELVGCGSALGFSTALLMRFKTFLDAGVGGTIYLFASRGRSPAREARRAWEDAARQPGREP